MILTFAVAGFASTFAGRITDPLVTVIAGDLAVSVKTIALLATAFALPYALIQPVLGPIGDGLGKLKVMRVCVGVLGLSLIAAAFAPDETSLFVLRIVSGAAAGGIIPLALAAIGDRVGMEGRQVAISRFLVAIILGQLAGTALSGLLAEWIGWRGVFVLSAAIAGIAFAAVTLGARRQTSAPGRLDFGLALARYRGLFAMVRARALFSFVFVEAAAMFGVFPFIAVLLEARGAGGAAEAGIAIAAFAVGGLLYSALVRWLLRVVGSMRMIAAGGVLGAVALVGVALAADWRLMAASLGLLGFAFYLMHNSYQTQVTELTVEARGSATALHACFFFLGAACGPALVSLGFAAIGEIPTLVLCGLAILVLGPVAARILTLTDPRRTAAR
ncbi:MFS transporter [Salinarimonas sp.]|uniref:MFS transporter n=1 Tax=Salinarimonas sp. TaxID=2766526 RepID=UPI00391B82C4